MDEIGGPMKEQGGCWGTCGHEETKRLIPAKRELEATVTNASYNPLPLLSRLSARRK